MHNGRKAHHTRERQAKLDSVNQQLATQYAFRAAVSLGPDSAVYGREDRAQK